MGKVEDWDEMIDTNVKGLLYVTRAVVPGMVVRGHGHVINLGSTAGELTYPNGAVYCATKAAERPDQRRPAPGCAGDAHTRNQRRSGHGGDGFQSGPLPRRSERAAKVYKGVKPLTAEDVADVIVWAASRPPHVNIARVLLTPVQQANSLLFHREG